MASRINQTLGLITTMRRAALIAPMRADRYLKIAAAMHREGMGITSGFASAAQRLSGSAGPNRRTGHLDLAAARRTLQSVG